MPSLIAFGRRWDIASDDFVFPELTEAFVRLLWMFFGIVVFVFHFPLSCSTKDVTYPMLILLAINGFTVVLSFITVAISSKGTIMNDLPRKHVATLLYIRLPVFVIEVIWNIYCTVIAFEQQDPASGCHFSIIIKVTILLEWILIICVFVGVVAVFNPVNEDGMEDVSMIARRSWSRRFRIFKIRQDVLMRAALDDLANLVATFFQGGDIVLSDVAAGLLLVVHSPLNEFAPLVDVSPARPSWMTEKNALHFLHFATCVYGWPTYFLHNCGFMPIARLARKLQCCGSLRCDQRRSKSIVFEKCLYDGEVTIVQQDKDKKKVLVIEDNCCFCNTAAFVLSTEDKNIDLFFVSFRNRLCEVPFVAFADHDSKSIVVTIRGSCSLMDLVTDLCLDEEIFSVDVDADPVLRTDSSLDTSHGQVRVHRGMLRSARYVFDCLRKHHVLEDMYVLNPTYQLVVCGHSLGAGVASLLTLLLKQQYPDIHCYAFSPPGCVISEEGLEEMEQHVMGVVGGDDVVPRISFQSLYRMRAKVELELGSCEKAKYEILIRGVFRLFFRAPWDTVPLSGITISSSDRDNLIIEQALNASYGTSTVSVSSEDTNDRSAEIPAPIRDRVQLYAPGKLLYIAKEEDSTTKRWIDARCLSEIKLSSSAITDHLPKNLTNVLEAVVDDMSSGSSSRTYVSV